MSKNLNIILPGQTMSVDGYSNIEITNLQGIYSYSIDSIICSVTSFLDQNNFWPAIEIMIDKLKPGGQIMLSLYDSKRLAYLYGSSQIEDTYFIQLIKNINNTKSLSDLNNFLEQKSNINLVEIKKDHIIDYVTLSKKE
jgi:hypothetical protein